jgi:hypothetical protein
MIDQLSAGVSGYQRELVYAACRSSAISAAITSESGRLAENRKNKNHLDSDRPSGKT